MCSAHSSKKITLGAIVAIALGAASALLLLTYLVVGAIWAVSAMRGSRRVRHVGADPV
jgi:hypothetical protein